MTPQPLARLAIGGLALALAACRTDRPAEAGASASPGAPATATPGGTGGTLDVTARDYAYDAPAEVPAGLTTIRLTNQGPSPHHVQLVRLAEGKRLSDLLEALKGEKFPAWATMAGGPAPPEVGRTSTEIQMLEPGTYALVCFIPTPEGMPHVMKGMSRELSVVGPAAPAGPEPEADLVIKLVDYDFQLSAPLPAGKHTIRVENAGPQPHEVAIVRLHPGKKPEDFAAWGMKQIGPPPGTIHGGVSGIMPGSRVFLEVDLPPGEYGLICFLPDSKDGKPHFVHGMVRQTSVSS
jgi:hypothetical protein